jgi:hypothetical protein
LRYHVKCNNQILIYVTAGWLRPCLVHLEHIGNFNELDCDSQIKKPRLAQEHEAIFVPIFKTERMEEFDLGDNLHGDFSNLNQELEVDPFLGYGQDLPSDNSTRQDHQLDLSKVDAEGTPWHTKKKAPQKGSRFVPILPKLPLGLSRTQQTEYSKTNLEPLGPIVMDKIDPVNHISPPPVQDNWPICTIPGFPVPHDAREMLDVSAQSIPTNAQLLNVSTSLDKDLECFGQESFETDPLELSDMSALESEAVPVFNDFSCNPEAATPKEISSSVTPLLGQNVNEEIQPAALDFKKLKYSEDIRWRLSMCPQGDTKVKTSFNWRDWISVDYEYCLLCLKPFGIQDERAAWVHLSVAHKLFVCDQCYRVFKSAFVLKTHMYEEHDILTKDLACLICNLVFINVHQRNEHIEKLHTWELYKQRIEACQVGKVNSSKKEITAKAVRTVPSILRRKRQC